MNGCNLQAVTNTIIDHVRSLCSCCLDCLEDVHSSFNFDPLNFRHTSDEHTTARHAITERGMSNTDRGRESTACVHTDTHTHTHTHTHAQTHTHMHMLVHTNTCMHTQTYTHLLTHSHMTIRGDLMSFCFFSTCPIILSMESVGGRPSLGQERK